jgi:hypothetical protein
MLINTRIILIDLVQSVNIQTVTMVTHSAIHLSSYIAVYLA